MPKEQVASSDTLSFIQRSIRDGRILWTYHVNMRMRQRSIWRSTIVASIDSFEIIEGYPEDRHLPSYLILARYEGTPIHVLTAVDLPGNNVRIITAYEPDPDEWEPDLRTRRHRP